MVPPPEQISHESQPDICSMLLIVVPAGLDGAGLGDGLGGELVELEAAGGAVGEVLEAAGAGFEPVVAAVAVLLGTEAVPPHPVTATRTVPANPTFRRVRGTKRISRF